MRILKNKDKEKQYFAINKSVRVIDAFLLSKV